MINCSSSRTKTCLDEESGHILQIGGIYIVVVGFKLLQFGG